MKFLDDTLQIRPSTSNIHTTKIDDSVSLENEDQELDLGSEENGTQKTPVSVNMPPPPPPQKRKVSSIAKDTSHSDIDKVIHYAKLATQEMLKMELATLFARTEMRELRAHNQRHVLSTPQSPLHSDSCSEHSTMTFTSGHMSPTY
ncbi:hypothetical protein HHI36_014358 [Cryptolaemus montrouzieri]|uniref:Uncharacterized protein n=1 Tax=Cryptolaemus montrouzieri TaxID=559131 RepID=A0ABD2N286_9CUCU